MMQSFQKCMLPPRPTTPNAALVFRHQQTRRIPTHSYSSSLSVCRIPTLCISRVSSSPPIRHIAHTAGLLPMVTPSCRAYDCRLYHCATQNPLRNSSSAQERAEHAAASLDPQSQQQQQQQQQEQQQQHQPIGETVLRGDVASTTEASPEQSSPVVSTQEQQQQQDQPSPNPEQEVAEPPKPPLWKRLDYPGMVIIVCIIAVDIYYWSH